MSKKEKSEELVGEDARKRTIRIANHRTSTAIQRLDLVANLGASGYQLTPDEKVKILKVIDESVEKIRQRFAGVKPVADRFSL